MWSPKEIMFSRIAQSGGCSDEEALIKAALQRSPTVFRARNSVFIGQDGEVSVLDVGKLKEQEQEQVLEKMVAAIDEDTELFFRRVRQRFEA